MAAGTYTIALVQMEATFLDDKRNAGRALKAVEDAADRGARLIVLPEGFMTGYIGAELDRAAKLACTKEDPRLVPFFEMAASRRFSGNFPSEDPDHRRIGRKPVAAVVDDLLLVLVDGLGADVRSIYGADRKRTDSQAGHRHVYGSLRSGLRFLDDHRQRFRTVDESQRRG